MRYTKRFVVALCLVLCMASAAFCIDPYKVNKGGFGPTIKGLQLGQKMSLINIVTWGVAHRGLPFTLRLNDEKENILSIQFYGKGTDFDGFNIERASGRYDVLLKMYYTKVIKTLGDLLSEVEKIGFTERYFFNTITLNDNMRIKELFFRAQDFGAEQMTYQEFAQAFINAYGIPGLDGVGRDKWQHRNLSQGWQVNVNGYAVSVEPIITKTAFD